MATPGVVVWMVTVVAEISAAGLPPMRMQSGMGFVGLGEMYQVMPVAAASRATAARVAMAACCR